MYKLFRPRIRSRHPSHNILRSYNKTLPLVPFRSIIRFGSSTVLKKSTKDRIELNTVDAIKNSSNKKLMKTCFTNAEVKTAIWWNYSNNMQEFIRMSPLDGNEERDVNYQLEDLPYPIIAKKHYGSRNNGNTKLNSAEELTQWMVGKNLNNYIFEKYYSYNREYRLHVTEKGCFYSCRKMLKSDAPDDVRWYRNDNHCVWIMPDNDLFDKPSNWEDIELECVKALKSVGLDFGAIDLRIQSRTKSNGDVRANPKFIIVEINSAPSFGEVTSQKYIEILPKLLKEKNGKK
jgi:D-alanine-D-alanine ligase-like ATP-grasp enzyme